MNGAGIFIHLLGGRIGHEAGWNFFLRHFQKQKKDRAHSDENQNTQCSGIGAQQRSKAARTLRIFYFSRIAKHNQKPRFTGFCGLTG
jgi:hypothetical protein